MNSSLKAKLAEAVSKVRPKNVSKEKKDDSKRATKEDQKGQQKNLYELDSAQQREAELIFNSAVFEEEKNRGNEEEKMGYRRGEEKQKLKPILRQ